ncbi:MAG: DUF167 family protein [Nitrospirales bacterium]|nr:YggU family protein [Nitrospira sp.]MDR4460712.1 DUF167 family protein [Nitrospirales bacterium]MDR4481816.1 DUF167 family protein [Nitrospirales bacterium]
MELGKCAIERLEGVELRIHIQPRSSKTEIVGLHGEALKIRIASPPVEGQANAELCRYLARNIGVPQQYVQLKWGIHSRQKRVFIAGKTIADIETALTKAHSLRNSEHP